MLKFSVRTREKKTSVGKTITFTEDHVEERRTKRVAVYDGRTWPVVSCGNIEISPEESVKQVTANILKVVPPDERAKRNTKHALAISTSFGHVHSFLSDRDSVWHKLSERETTEQCLMLIKKPKTSAKQMLKAHSWANLTVSDSHLHSQLDGTLHSDSRKHHKYRMKRKQSDLQLVPERRGQIENWIQEQNAHLQSRTTNPSEVTRPLSNQMDSSKKTEINNNKISSRRSEPQPSNMVPTQRLFSSERNLTSLDCNSNEKSGTRRNESYIEPRQQSEALREYANRTETCKYGPPKPPRVDSKHSPNVNMMRDPKISPNVNKIRDQKLSPNVNVLRDQKHSPSVSMTRDKKQSPHMNVSRDQKLSPNVNTGRDQKHCSNINMKDQKYSPNVNVPRERTLQTCSNQMQTPYQTIAAAPHNVQQKTVHDHRDRHGNWSGQADMRQNMYGHHEYRDPHHQKGIPLRTDEQGVDKMYNNHVTNPQLATNAGSVHSDKLKNFVPVQPYRDVNSKKANEYYSHYQNREVILRNSETNYSTYNKNNYTQSAHQGQTANRPNMESHRRSEGNYQALNDVNKKLAKNLNKTSAVENQKQGIRYDNYPCEWHSVKTNDKDDFSGKGHVLPQKYESLPKGGNQQMRNSHHTDSTTYGYQEYYPREHFQPQNRFSQVSKNARLPVDSKVKNRDGKQLSQNMEFTTRSRAETSSGDMQKDEANQIKSDELYDTDAVGVISEKEVDSDMEQVLRAQSMGDLTTGLTFSLVGQLKAESMVTLPVSTEIAEEPLLHKNTTMDKSPSNPLQLVQSNQISDLNSSNTSAERTSDSDFVEECDKSVTKHRRTLPQAPGDFQQKKKRYTELVQMKIRSASSRNTQSSPQSDNNVTDTPLDQEVSDFLQMEGDLGARISPQEVHQSAKSDELDNNNGRHIHTMMNIESVEKHSPESRHLSGDSTHTTRASHGSTVDSGYLTNDPENDFYSSSSYTLSIQRSAQNIYSRVQDQNGVTRQVTPKHNDVTEAKMASQYIHDYENCYSVSRAEPSKAKTVIVPAITPNVPKHKRSSDPCISSREQMVVQATENSRSLTNLHSNANTGSSRTTGHASHSNRSNEPNVTPNNAMIEHHFQPIRSPESTSSQYTCNTLPKNKSHSHSNIYERTFDLSSKNASLFLILQKYRLFPIRINLPKNCSLFEFVQLQDDIVELPLMRNSPTDHLVTSTPRGKCATLGGPGSAFKPVGGKQNITMASMVTVSQVADQLTQSCDIGELLKDDLIVELDGHLVIGANLSVLRSYLQRSESTVTLTVGRKCPEFPADVDVSVITESKDTLLLEQEVGELRQKMSKLTTELEHRDQHIQQLHRIVPQTVSKHGNINYSFPQNRSVIPTDSFLNGLDEDEFIV
ncbi:hypothetical protein ScPMuIL_016951 [Solemya velum]